VKVNYETIGNTDMHKALTVLTIVAIKVTILVAVLAATS